MVAACPFPWPRGTPVRIFRMAESLAGAGHDVHIVTYHIGEGSQSKPFHIHRIPNVANYEHVAPGPTIRKLLQLDPMLFRQLRSLHQARPFDIIHGHHFEGVTIAARAVRDTPIIYDAHTTLAGELPHYPLGLPFGVKRAIGRLLDRILPRQAHKTIAVSESIRRAMISVGAARPADIHVIPNGVESDTFDLPKPSSDVPGFTIIYTGTTAPYQRLDLLLAAFAHLHKRVDRARLQIITNSPFTPFEESSQRLGIREAIDVRDVPFADQPILLAAADVAVSPRIQCDGIPQKLLNYMAAGKPVVAFEGSAVHLRHEVTGLRVPNGDISGMACAMERLLNNPELARRMGEAAQAEVRKEFSWSAVASKVEKVYRDAILNLAQIRGFEDKLVVRR